MQGQLPGYLLARVLWALLCACGRPGPAPRWQGALAVAGSAHLGLSIGGASRLSVQVVLGQEPWMPGPCWLWAVGECMPRGACLGAGRAAGMLCFPGKSSISQLLMTNSAFPQTLCQPVQTDLPERGPGGPQFQDVFMEGPHAASGRCQGLRLRAVIPWKTFLWPRFIDHAASVKRAADLDMLGGGGACGPDQTEPFVPLTLVLHSPGR